MGDKKLRQLPFLLSLIRSNLSTIMEFRISFLAHILFMVLNNLIFLVFWWIFFKKFEEVGGWKLRDMLTLYALAAFAFGLANIVFGNVMRLSSIIVSGGVDAYLTFPRDPLMHILMSRMSAASIGDVLFSLLLLHFYCQLSGAQWLIFLCAGICGAIIFTAFGTMVHSLSFFFGSSEGISRLIHESLITLSIYPESIFSGWIQLLIYTLIPAGFMTHFPVTLIRDFDVSYAGLLVVVTFLWVVTAKLFFSAGLRRYESGNLVAPRQ